MKRLAKWITRLYPSRWRRRYGEEVDALVDDAGADLRTLTDLFAGALRMQFSTWSFPRLAAVLAIMGMLAGAAIVLLTPARYTARTELTLTGADSPAETMLMVRSRVTSRTELASVINNPWYLLYRDELRTTPLEDVIEEMKNDVAINLDGPERIAVQFTYPDKAKALLVVRRLAFNADEVLRDAGKTRSAATKPLYMDVVDTASLPNRPLRLNPLIGASAGLLGGLMFAAIWQSCRRLRPSARLMRPARTGIKFAVAGLAAGVAIAWFMPSLGWLSPEGNPNGKWPLLYESHATLYAETGGTSISGILTEATSRSSLAYIIADPRLRLYSTELKTHELEEITAAMRQRLVITTRGEGRGRWIDISFKHYDRFQCQQTVSLLINRLQDLFNASVRNLDPGPARSKNWGRIQFPDAPAPDAVTAVNRDFSPDVSYGLLAGLALAVVIASIRRRWESQENDEALATTPGRPFRFEQRFFGRLAIGFGVAGALAGTVLMIRTPVRYTSDALVAFGGAYPNRAATLINDATNRAWPQIAAGHNLALAQSRRDLAWQQVNTDDTISQTFRFAFISDNPRQAQFVLQDVVGAIDRRLVELRGTDEKPFETIRGVDGALASISNSTDLMPAPGVDLYSEELLKDAKTGVPLGELAVNLRRELEPVSSEGMNRIIAPPPVQAPPSIDIPFDDERARPLPQPQYRAVSMNVIDAPSLPVPTGAGWLSVAEGLVAGLLLALVITVIRGFRGGQTAKSPDLVAGASLL